MVVVVVVVVKEEEIVHLHDVGVLVGNEVGCREGDVVGAA